uniref:C-type lectin domain-containing protein n=1 Tax=Monopterus albus TaxID=43700 RepID=A0A3Q3K531_MONAL
MKRPIAPTTVLPKAFYKLGNDSYKLVAQKMRWDEARRQCKADDADLASILNPITQAYITLRISKHNEPVWIGLNSNTGGRFKWVDNWLLSYTKWGRDEPKNNYAPTASWQLSRAKETNNLDTFQRPLLCLPQFKGGQLGPCLS